MFALIAAEAVYCKVDEVNRADFEAPGMLPLTHEGQGRPIQRSDYEIPPAVWQDLSTLVHGLE